MKTSRLSTTPTTTTSTPATSASSTVGSRLFSTPKVDSSPLNFENEKDLNKKLEEIINEFKNKEKDWSYRLKSLQLLQRIINGNAIEFKGWPTLLRTLSSSLIEQLTELRSTIVKEACQSVSLLSQRMKNKFEQFALLYIQPLIRMVPVKTTVIAESAHQSIKDILENVPTKNLLQVFLDASLDQHNEQLRKRSAEYIYIILNKAIESEGMILVSSIPALEKSIQKLLVDGASETRQVARYCFWSYIELNEKSATALFYQFTPTTQKNLFTVIDNLQGEQLEIAEKMKKTLFEEEQDQKMIEDLDMDIDINDFKKTPNNNNNTTGTNNDSPLRSKTPTGRASGLKTRISVKTPTSTDSSSLRRAGSSLSNRESVLGSSTSTSTSTSIKKPLDPSSMIRSKSSLGTTRKLDSLNNNTTITSSSSSTNTTTTKSTSPVSSTSSPLSKTIKTTSPNLATSSLSGRYSSIGTRAVGKDSLGGAPSPLSKMPSSSNLTRSLPPINKSPVSPPQPAPPQPTLTKSKSTPSSPLTQKPTTTSSTTTTTTTSTTPKKTTSSTAPSTPTTPGLKKPSSLQSPSGTTKTLSSSTSALKSKSSSTLSTTSSLTPTKKSFITKTILENDETNPPINDTTTNKTPSKSSSSLNKTDTTLNRKSITNELDLESLEISLNQDNGLAFQEISDELSNSIRDAKKGLSYFHEDELTLDDLESSDHTNGKSNNKRDSTSISSFKNNIRKANTADLEFNWLEDSVHDSLIEDDVLDFNDENNSNSGEVNSNSGYSSKSNLSSNRNSTIIEEDELNEINQEQEEKDEKEIDDDQELMF